MPDYTGVAYLRRSKIRKGREHETISIDKQRAAVEAKAAEIGVTHLDVYVDAGGHRSGRTTKHRPDWNRLKARLVEPDCRVLVVFMIDRSARSVREIAELVDVCQSHGKRLVTCRDGVDTDRTGWTANAIADINFRAVVAQYQSDNTADLMRQTAQRFREALGLPWGMVPFGVQRIGRGALARLTADPVHGETVATLLRLYAGGLSYDATAEALNTRGLRHLDRARAPKRWGREAVRAVVGNVLFYAGYVILSQPGTRRHAKQERVALDGDGTYLDRYARAMQARRSPAIEPLIDEALACAVIERRHKSQYVGRRTLEWTPLLTPVLYCDGPDGTRRKLRADTTRHGAHIYRSRDGGVWIDADLVDGEIMGRLSEIDIPDEMIGQVREFVAARLGDAERTRAAEALDAQRARLDRLIALHVDGMIPREAYNAQYGDIERAIRQAQEALSRPTDVERAMRQLRDFAGALSLMTAENRKRAFLKLFDQVGVNHEGDVIRLRLRGWFRAAVGDLALWYAKGAPGERLPRTRQTGLGWIIARAA